MIDTRNIQTLERP